MRILRGTIIAFDIAIVSHGCPPGWEDRHADVCYQILQFPTIWSDGGKIKVINVTNYLLSIQYSQWQPTLGDPRRDEGVVRGKSRKPLRDRETARPVNKMAAMQMGKIEREEQ